MRVVGGSERGRPLVAPTGEGTRPTADRAREGLFSSLQSLVDVEGCRFLDLYAGSGAVGLEALSRGAEHVVLVESDARALEAVRANVGRVGLPGAQVVAAEVLHVLARETPEPFDVVFADPPYAVDLTGVLEVLPAWLADDAVVVLERQTRGGFAWPEGWTPLRDRRYGEATLWYGSRS